MVSPDVNDPIKSIIKIEESTENNNEEFKTDRRTIDNNANDNTVVSTNIINSKSTNEIRKENQNWNYSSASIQEQNQEQQPSKKLSNNRPNAIVWKDNTSEQKRKVIILDDNMPKMLEDVISYISWKILRCMWRIFLLQRLKCKTTSNIFLGKTSGYLIIQVGTNDISANKQPDQIAESVVELRWISEK